MELSEIKRVKELTSVEKVNEHLKNGWQIITIYQPEYLKDVRFVLGSTSKAEERVVFLAAGIKAEYKGEDTYDR